MDNNTFLSVITIFGSLLASSGFWAYLQYRTSKKDHVAQLALGLAHDRLLFLGRSYIKRGFITMDEYENLVTYLYEPYKLNGGNGTIAKIMVVVDTLPVMESNIDTIKKEDINYVK